MVGYRDDYSLSNARVWTQPTGALFGQMEGVRPRVRRMVASGRNGAFECLGGGVRSQAQGSDGCDDRS